MEELASRGGTRCRARNYKWNRKVTRASEGGSRLATRRIERAAPRTSARSSMLPSAAETHIDARSGPRLIGARSARPDLTLVGDDP